MGLLIKIKFGAREEDEDDWCETQLGVEFNSDGLYNKIKDNNLIFTEYIGVYYQEERDTGYSEIPKSNRTEKRVITYKEVS